MPMEKLGMLSPTAMMKAYAAETETRFLTISRTQFSSGSDGISAGALTDSMVPALERRRGESERCCTKSPISSPDTSFVWILALGESFEKITELQKGSYRPARRMITSVRDSLITEF